MGQSVCYTRSPKSVIQTSPLQTVFSCYQDEASSRSTIYRSQSQHGRRRSPRDLPDVVKYEMQAFEQCENDGVDGLSWDEVEACEDMFGDQLEELGIALPSEDDFNASDLNGDGTLLFEEWEEWANLP